MGLLFSGCPVVSNLVGKKSALIEITLKRFAIRSVPLTRIVKSRTFSRREIHVRRKLVAPFESTVPYQ